MGTIIRVEPGRRGRPVTTAAEALPRVLASLIEAGMADFALGAVTAWGRRELPPAELLELCQTYAAVAGLREAADP